MTEVDLIHEWLEKARHDLNTAKVVAEHLPDYDDTIAFHCQQAIEKLFKAYLIYLNVEFKPVHDLGYLLNLIGSKVNFLDSFYDRVDKVSRYAVQIRYPDTMLKLSKDQIKDAIYLADLLFNLVSKKMI